VYVLGDGSKLPQPGPIIQIIPLSTVVHAGSVARVHSEVNWHTIRIVAVHARHEVVGLVNGPRDFTGDVHLLVIQGRQSLAGSNAG